MAVHLLPWQTFPKGLVRARYMLGFVVEQKQEVHSSCPEVFMA